MFRWFVIFFVFLLNMGRVQAARETSIYTVTYRSKHPEYSWLKRFLRLRGYKPTQQSGSTLSLKLLPGSKVLVMRGQRSQQYSIPAQVVSPVTRARMCVLYLDMFLDSLRRQPKPAPKPALVKQKRTKPTIVKRRRPQRRLTARKSIVRRRTRRRRLALAVRSQVRKPVVRVVPVARKASTRSNPSSALTPTKRPLVRRKAAIASRKKPKPRAKQAPKQVPKPRKRKTKVASFSGVEKVGVRAHTAPPRRIQIWGDILSLDLGLSGGFRWSNESVVTIIHRIMGGGSALFGLNAWRWTLRIDLNFHSYFLQKQSRTLAFVRPSFWLGYRIPLGKGERYLHLYAMLGTGTDLFVEEKSDSYKTILHWGIAVALQLHWNITKRWSLFLRPALLVFPGGFGVSQSQEAFLSAPILQVSGMVGLQVRF